MKINNEFENNLKTIKELDSLISNDIIHRDLKPDNILIDKFLFPKITDFGLAKVINSDQTILNSQSEFGFKGTTSYSALEVLEKNLFSKASDIYAFGLIVYEILTNQELYKDYSFYKVSVEVVSGIRPDLDSDIPDAYK